MRPAWTNPHPETTPHATAQATADLKQTTADLNRSTGEGYRRTAWHADGVSTLRDLVEEHTSLEPADIEHLHRLAGDWQLVSDLSFADLLMWVPLDGRGDFLCVAQVRPTTAPTAYQDDQVGRIAGRPSISPR